MSAVLMQEAETPEIPAARLCEHCGGPLTKRTQRLYCSWACANAAHGHAGDPGRFADRAAGPRKPAIDPAACNLCGACYPDLHEFYEHKQRCYAERYGL